MWVSRVGNWAKTALIVLSLVGTVVVHLFGSVFEVSLSLSPFEFDEGFSLKFGLEI